MVNKWIARKSVCADCDAKKSVFVKGYKPDKKKKFSQITKICRFIVKTVKKTQVMHFPKNYS